MTKTGISVAVILVAVAGLILFPVQSAKKQLAFLVPVMNLAMLIATAKQTTAIRSTYMVGKDAVI